MDTPLRVAIVADPYIPVPPVYYGGIERIIDFLVEGLIRRGHEVTLLAHAESQTRAKQVAYGSPSHFGIKNRTVELSQVGGTLWRERDNLDVVHSFGRLAALLPILPLRSIGKIQTYQRVPVPWNSVAIASHLAGNSLLFTGCSTSAYSDAGQSRRAGKWTTVFNGVPISRFDFAATVARDAPLVFLGRVERIKGAHSAIAIAKAAGKRLVIAGNRSESGEEARYFDSEIAPHLRDGNIEYVGPLDDVQKNSLLGSAAALLMPIEWEEPFGIVMAEALACGTPVIGFRRGSVPEVVENGVTGFVVDDISEAVEAVAKLPSLSRRAARNRCEKLFSDTVIVEEYENLYRMIAERSRQ